MTSPTFPTRSLFDPAINRLVYVPAVQTDIRVTFAKFASPNNPLSDRNSNEEPTRDRR